MVDRPIAGVIFGGIVAGGVVTGLWLTGIIGDNPQLTTRAALLDGAKNPQGGETANDASTGSLPETTNPKANDPNYKQNLMTQAYFLREPDPYAYLGGTRECYKLEPYTQDNQQTVVGAVTVMGDPNSYLDQEAINVTVYNPDGTVLGSFTNAGGELPDDETYGTVGVGTTVCSNGPVTVYSAP